jgi:predicted P-loop ATPase
VDSFSVEGKEAYENMRGKWIVEISELVALKKSDSNVIKNFLSKTSDFYRAAYDRYPQDQPRQCVFFGSGNEAQFLKGIGGDRRFWPVVVSPERKSKDWKEFTDYEVDQIWAEAKHYFEKGEKPFLSKEIEALARQKQAEHVEFDSWEDNINEFLDKLLPENWKNTEICSEFADDSVGTVKRDSVTVREIWEQCMRQKQAIDYNSTHRITNIMNRKKNWEYRRHYRPGKKTQFRGWIKTENTDQNNELKQRL